MNDQTLIQKASPWFYASGTTIAPRSTAVVNVNPPATDGAALGSASVMWSDLFLASGAVINFNNGNTTITHSAGVLTMNSGTVFSCPKFTTTGTGTYSGLTLASGESIGILSAARTIWTSVTTAAGAAFYLDNGGSNFNATTGAGQRQIEVLSTFAPASGSSSYAMLHLNPTINGTSSGTAYGLGIASKTNTLTGGTIRLFSVGTTTTDLFTGYTGVFEIETSGAFTYGGVAGGATTTRTLVKKITGIADNTATDVFTVTVPNANHAAAIKVTFLSSNGSTDAFESSRVATGSVVLARTTGVTTVAGVSTLEAAQIATVAAGATHTLAYGVTAMSGAAGATQTFTIQVTIDDSGNVGSNQVVAVAELINSEATGVTIA